MEIFRQDVFWKELLIEKRECSMETITGNGMSAEDWF